MSEINLKYENKLVAQLITAFMVTPPPKRSHKIILEMPAF